MPVRATITPNKEILWALENGSNDPPSWGIQQEAPRDGHKGADAGSQQAQDEVLPLHRPTDLTTTPLSEALLTQPGHNEHGRAALPY